MREKRIYTPPARAKPEPAAEEWRGQPAMVEKSRGTGPFYLVAFLATLLSLDTAVRFFGEELGIAGLKVHEFSVELAAVCGIGELTLIACGYAMRHNVRRPGGKPGAAQSVAFAMCAAAAFMAYAIGGPVGGTVRTVFGPVTALVTLHLALRIEVKIRRGFSDGAWARVGRELRERALSRLGLADDHRDAATRTRDRAADRAARLAASGRVPFRRARLAKAVRAAGVALDEGQKDRMLRQVAALKTLDSLMDLRPSSPWMSPDARRVSLVKAQPALTLADVERVIDSRLERLASARKPEPRPVRERTNSPAQNADRTNGRGRPPSPDRAPALEFVRAERAAGRPVSAGDLVRRFTKSEGWARGVLAEAAAQESPNGKVHVGL